MALTITISRNKDQLGRRASHGGRFRFIVDDARNGRQIFKAIGKSVDALRARAESLLGISLERQMPTLFARERRQYARIVLADNGERAALREMLYALLEVSPETLRAALEPAFAALEGDEPAALVQVPRSLAKPLRGLLATAASREPTVDELVRGVTEGAFARVAGRL